MRYTTLHLHTDEARCRMTKEDELVQMIPPCSKDDTNQQESDDKEPLSFTLELGEVDLQVKKNN